MVEITVATILVKDGPEIQLPESLRLKAFTSLDRMMKITSNKSVIWPDHFQV